MFTYDFLFGCSEISFSDDEGETWTTSTLNCGLQDHQNLFTGPPVTSPTVGYPNIVYTCSTQGGATIYSLAAQCLKSLDGGLTWSPTGAPRFRYRHAGGERPRGAGLLPRRDRARLRRAGRGGLHPEGSVRAAVARDKPRRGPHLGPRNRYRTLGCRRRPSASTSTKPASPPTLRATSITSGSRTTGSPT